MAIFHLDVKTILRSQGRSVTAGAAYRAGEKIIDKRLGMEFDYSRKQGVGHSEIMAPPDAPNWVNDRTQLWNAVEAGEKRKDSQLAREVMIALPKELTAKENVELVRDFCRKEFVSKGMVADMNIHSDNPENPHVHILLTMREIGLQGFGLKNRDWNKRELVFELRHSWQEMANRHLYIAGHEAQIDCRSLKDRGIELEPNLHLGPAAHRAKERGQGDDFTIHADSKEIMRANGERIIHDPSIALQKLTQQQSVFDDYAIAKLANQHSADLEQYHQVIGAIKTCDKIVSLGENEYGKSVFSSVKMVELEHQMLNHAYDLNLNTEHKIDMAAANKALVGKSLTSTQAKAYSHIINEGNLKIITGLAGTGKSYLMGAVREAFEQSGYKLSGVALSGIAAQGLQEGSGIVSSTVDSRLMRLAKGTMPLSKKDVLVIDEAGMLGTEKMTQLLSHANKAGSKVIIVHDKEQLSAIDAGAPSRALAERFGEVALTEVVRQKTPEMRQATFEFGTGKTENALQRYETLGSINCNAIDETIAQRLMIEAWATNRLEGKSQLMLAFTNESVKALNEAARKVRIGAGEIVRGEQFTVAKGKRSFAVGDRIYFLKNDSLLGVKNGTLGTLEAIKGNNFGVKLDGKENRAVKFNLLGYKELDHGYAATIHKSQGVTVDKTYVLVSKYFDRHLTYVACTRHRESLHIYGHRGDFKNRDVFLKILSRERSKSMVVDFAQSRYVTPKNRHELNLNPHGITQKEKAQERAEIKKLKEKLPDKEFSFGRTLEHVKGWVQGVVRLSDNRQMLCIAKENHIKLVSLAHDFIKHVGKQVNIKLNRHACIDSCKLIEKQGDTVKETTVIERGQHIDINKNMELKNTKAQSQQEQSQQISGRNFDDDFGR